MVVRVQQQDFSLADEVAALTANRSDIGAVVTFTGLVRDTSGDLASLELEHYPAMTQKALEDIAKQAADRWPLQACTIIHRYGKLAPSEQIMMVATASAHRAAAFAAADFLMDFLKSRAPFWKKEHDTAGQGSWVDAKEDDEAALNRWSKP